MSEGLIVGRVRELFPRVVVELPGPSGPVSVDFIVDTGFDGELALPTSLLRRLEAYPAGQSLRAMGDGTVSRYEVFEIDLEWNGSLRTLGVIRLELNPLLGMELLSGWRLEIDLTEGGDVVLEPPD